MSNRNPKLFPFAKISCGIFGHKLLVSKNITDHIHEYECCKCGMEMTDTANGFLARLTPKFKETNSYLERFYNRRRARKLFAKAS